MKTRTAARTIVLISLLLLILTLAYGWIWADGVIHTNEWVNFLSANTTFLGQPVPVGAYIAAYDPDGVQCGEYTVDVEGQYGVMPCYRDDGMTPEDEGADPGDVISFTINGLPATPVPISLNNTPVAPSTTITWTAHGDLWEVDLHVVAAPTETPTPTATPTETPTPTPTETPTPVPMVVGGYGEPVSRLELLALRLRSGRAPWLGLAALASLAALAVVLVRRRGRA